MTATKNGIDKILAEPLPQLRGLRFGLLFNQASLTADGRYAADALAEAYPKQLTALFSPQHGVWGEEQANMIETGHTQYIGLPLFSLYSETRQPTATMLERIDALVIDLQDVGTRVYTFIWTMLKCLEACAAHGKHVVVLDRPNPVGGLQVGGPELDQAYKSFVGLATIPMQHAMTMGELANMFVSEQNINVDLTVVPMQDWQRTFRYPQTGRTWFCPSPNMPTYRTTVVYPGGVLLEGTNLSEGRGTTIPFEVVGAPFIDERALSAEMNARGLPGVRFRATRFRPTFDKWRGESCRGLFIDVTNEYTFDSYRTTLHLLHAIRTLHGDLLQWLPPPYEYETVKPPIDILTGSDAVRTAIDAGCSVTRIDELSATSPEWHKRSQAYWLYD